MCPATADHRVGLVLGAGGSVGIAFHNGVLSGLQAATGWDPASAEVIVGTSAGAIAAACVTGGARVAEPPYEQGGVDTPLEPSYARSALLHAARRPWALRPVALGAALVPPGQGATDYLAKGIDLLPGGEWPWTRPWVCAVRLSDGARVVFGAAGSPPARLGEAVAASCAVPGRFRPVMIGGRAFGDGGVWSMHNVDVVK
ncbi:MAG: patatin-like phospholipase family protein, partial [Acidimicrobiales bacterium]